MYPFLKFSVTLLKAKYRPKLNIDERSVLQCRAGFSDVDMFMELNNARYFNYMELDRGDILSDIPDWINAWSEAESKRPWPT